MKIVDRTWPRKSYSQMGEDLIIENNLRQYNLSANTLSYLEVGTNHPCQQNNTFLFYEQGAFGVLIEPDERYWGLIQKKRSKDKLIKACVGDFDAPNNDFYIMTAGSLNTLKKDVAQQYCNAKKLGKQKIKKIIQIKVIHINKILKQNFKKWPNILSIDTEGYDFKILNAIDWKTFCVEIVCVESGNSKKETIQLMHDNKYRILGDNCLNLIFGKIN